MQSRLEHSKPVTLFLASRPKFLTASAAPILVGSALGYAAAGTFSVLLFVLAVLAIMALHAGANMANDYFDHISRNDWLNQNTTPFSGGSRYIQNGILSPKAILLTALFFLAAGSALGLIIVLLTRSLVILVIGLIGLFGGFFYTAPPLKLGYRAVGEPVIGILFGLLPVYGSYYLQTGTVDAVVLLPAAIVAILIFLIILINEFPDLAADAAVNKKTLIVCFGVPASIWIYRVLLIASFVIAAAAIFVDRIMFFAGLFYLLILPMAVIAIKFANRKDLTTPGQHRANGITILLHMIGALALTAGFLLSGLSGAAI
ncbi:MAG: 1,4-dihydroxy-2-naphthoate octaprenyltransferase [Planctomycetota bacterium]|jgi:1,4-dihydroxy-2-naphthoate octaprenyltransferase